MALTKFGLQLLLCCIPFAFLCALAGAGPPPSKLRPDVLSAIRQAPQLEVFRLRTRFVSPAGIEMPGPDVRMVDGFVVTKRGQTAGAKTAAKLAGLLADIQNHPSRPLRCGFRAGAGYQIKTASGTLNVLFCFHCDAALITEDDQTGKTLRSALIYFDRPHRTKVLSLVRETFPDDAELSRIALL